MLIHHLGLKVFLLLAVVGHAALLAALGVTRSSAGGLELVLMIAPLVSVLLGEWLADDAVRPSFRKLGWWIVLVGATFHLLLDAGCFLLPFVRADTWWSPLSVVAGTIVMAIQAWIALAALRSPEGLPPVIDYHAQPTMLSGIVVRELALFGGTPLSITAVGTGFVVMALVGMTLRGVQMKIVGAMLFFAVVAAVGFSSGLERRASILGKPSPWAGLFRGLRRASYHAAREGLALISRREVVLYPWSQITSVVPGEWQGNQALFVQLVESPTVLRRARRPRPADQDARWEPRAPKERGAWRAFANADLVIMSVLTTSGTGPLRLQMEAALTGPSRVDELPSVEQLLG